jgi:hypothetical protein
MLTGISRYLPHTGYLLQFLLQILLRPACHRFLVHIFRAIFDGSALYEAHRGILASVTPPFRSGTTSAASRSVPVYK